MWININKIIYKWVTLNNIEDIYDSALNYYLNIKEYLEYIQYWNIWIYEYPWSFFLLEFFDKDSYNSLLEIFYSSFKPKGYFCEIEEDWNQYPKLLSYWENNWKYYILIEVLENLNTNNNQEKWIYKGLIINPLLYKN